MKSKNINRDPMKQILTEINELYYIYNILYYIIYYIINCQNVRIAGQSLYVRPAYTSGRGRAFDINQLDLLLAFISN